MDTIRFDRKLLFGVLNGRVSAAINRKMYRKFRTSGLEITPEQWTVLLYLWDKDGVSQQELCNATYKDKPSMTRLIDNLERMHLVVRVADKNDRRSNIIHLTKDARDIEKKVRELVHETFTEALEGVTPEVLASGELLLKTVFENTRD